MFNSPIMSIKLLFLVKMQDFISQKPAYYEHQIAVSCENAIFYISKT
jgi:hypothetical protein